MKKQSTTAQSVLLHVGLVLMSIVVLYPVLWVVKLALSPGQAPSLSASPLPDAVTLDNFKDVLFASDTQGRWLFGRQLLASLTVSGATTIVGLTLSVSAAWALSRFRFPGVRAACRCCSSPRCSPRR